MKQQELIKMQKKFQKSYPEDYNLLIAQDFWPVHCQILLITLLKRFIKLNANTNSMIKNVQLVELNIKIPLRSGIHKL